MPIIRVPRGTIREEDQPIHKIAMLRALDPTRQTDRERHADMGATDEDLAELDRGEVELPKRKKDEHAWTPGEDRPSELERRKGIVEGNQEAMMGDYFEKLKRRYEAGLPLSGERQPNQYEIKPENIAFKPTLGDKKLRDELQLTPQEAKMYGRHITNLKGPGGVDHPNGARSTLMNMGVELGGKYYNIPRVYDGKILSPDDAVKRAQDAGLENFPSYKNQTEAEARYKDIHKYMEKDAQQFFRREAGGPLQEKTAFPIEGMDISQVDKGGSRGYGDRRSSGHHAGLDIRTPMGTPLKATDNGAVIRTYTQPGQGYGHSIDVQMADGTIHRLAHLGSDDRSVNPYGKFKPGDTFKAGDIIGYSGRSGTTSSAPHVHYEVFPSRGAYDKSLTAGNSHQAYGLRIDPSNYFSGGRDQAVKEHIKQIADTGGQPSAGPAGSKREVAQTVAKELRAAGYPDNAIAGILRNIDEESSFNPRSLTRDDQKDPRFAGTEARHGHGLFSEGGDEFNNMQAWMKEKHPNSHWSDTKVQSEWIAHRLKTGYKGLDAKLRDPSITKEGAADAFLKGYLKPSADNLNRRSAHYQKGIPGVEHYTGAIAPQAQAVAAAPTAPAAPEVPAPPKEGPVEDPTIASRQRELSQRPAPGPEDPSIQARAREQRETAPSVTAPAGTALAPTMGEEHPEANPIGLSDAPTAMEPPPAGKPTAPGAPPPPPPTAPPPQPAGVEDPSIVARQRELAGRPAPGIEDPRFQAFKRQEDLARAQSSAPISGSEPPGDFNIAVRSGGVGSDAVAGGGGGGGGSSGAVNNALDSWKPGQPIMGALLGDIFGGGGGGLFGGKGGGGAKFQNLVQSYNPSPDAILPAAGPEPPSTLPTNIPPPPAAPPPTPPGMQPVFSQRQQRRRFA